MTRDRAPRLLLPLFVAFVLIGLWQWWVTAYDIPQFLVPSPLVVLQTLIKDGSLLGAALLVTPSVTGLRFLPCWALLALLWWSETEPNLQPHWATIGFVMFAFGVLWSPESLFMSSVVYVNEALA